MTHSSHPKAGLSSHPMQESPGRVRPETSSSPVPEPWRHPGIPGTVGERVVGKRRVVGEKRVLGYACQHRGPPGATLGLLVAVWWGNGGVWSSPFLSIQRGLG